VTEELKRRVIAGLEPEIELFGSSRSGSILRLPGVIASISPATPERSIFNSVAAADAAALAAAADGLDAAYADAGVSAWTVWVPDHDRESAELLAARGHVLDGAPRAMGVDLADLQAPERPWPPEAELVAGELGAIGIVNDRAYEHQDGWSAAVEELPDRPMKSAMALIDGEPVACAIVLDHGDNACVTGVATVPEHQGKGLAGHIIAGLLSDARARGAGTATLQASAAGAPVYERLGFRDVGFIELWELRKA
jgi:GNAT superfamily N-acetyltransferase